VSLPPPPGQGPSPHGRGGWPQPRGQGPRGEHEAVRGYPQYAEILSYLEKVSPGISQGRPKRSLHPIALNPQPLLLSKQAYEELLREEELQAIKGIDEERARGLQLLRSELEGQRRSVLETAADDLREKMGAIVQRVATTLAKQRIDPRAARNNSCGPRGVRGPSRRQRPNPHPPGQPQSSRILGASPPGEAGGQDRGGRQGPGQGRGHRALALGGGRQSVTRRGRAGALWHTASA